jgi:adenine phosphoribosyltransferase
MPQRATYAVEIGGVSRLLPIVEVAPGLKIAVLNILGDAELVEGCAKALALRLKPFDFNLLVTAEAKSIPLIHAMAVEMGKDYVILRKSYKPYMGDAIEAETLSITTGAPQTLFLDEKDRDIAAGQRVLLVDDVISTGSTLEGMRKVMRLAGANIVAEAAVFTEGDPEKWKDVIALGHLPLFLDE